MNETEIRTNFIPPLLSMQAGINYNKFGKARIITRGKIVTRANPKSSDYVLIDISNIPLAVVEAKDNKST